MRRIPDHTWMVKAPPGGVPGSAHTVMLVLLENLEAQTKEQGG